MFKRDYRRALATCHWFLSSKQKVLSRGGILVKNEVADAIDTYGCLLASRQGLFKLESKT